MLIIIEGCDQTGKTTLAQHLQDELYPLAQVWHAGPPTAHPLEAYETPLAAYDPHGEWHVILDRYHLGEHVWPQIFGRDSQLDVAVARHIELYLRSRGAWVVYAERDPQVLAAAVDAADPPEPITGRQVPQVLNLFGDALAFAGRPISNWNFDRDNELLIINSIIAHAAAQEIVVSHPHSVTAEWIGAPYPELLLVGDEFGLTREDAPNVPFAPYPNTSGHYLLSALPAELWRDVAIVNAHQGREGKLTDLHALWTVLQKPRTVALGNNATAALQRQEVPHAVVPHPQYWRRFHYHDMDSYTGQLREAYGCTASALTT